MTLEKVLTELEDGQIAALGNAKWTDRLPKLMQARIIQSFENNGSLGQVNRPVEGSTPEFQLLIDIRRFQIVSVPEPTADAEISAKLVASDGRVIAAQIFDAKVPAKTQGEADAAKALNQTFKKLAPSLMSWTADMIASADEKQPPAAQVLKPAAETRK